MCNICFQVVYCPENCCKILPPSVQEKLSVLKQRKHWQCEIKDLNQIFNKELIVITEDSPLMEPDFKIKAEHRKQPEGGNKTHF